MVEILYKAFSAEQSAEWAATYKSSSSPAIKGQVGSGNHLYSIRPFAQSIHSEVQAATYNISSSTDVRRLLAVEIAY